MSAWWTPAWKLGGGLYVVSIACLATWAFAGDRFWVYQLLILVTLPVGYLMILPIYIVVGVASSALGHDGLEPTAVSVTIAVAGFTLAAAANVVLARFAVATLATCWTRRSVSRTPG